MAREHPCPFCGIHGIKIFGSFFKNESINAVNPAEARELAKDVLACSRETCVNYNWFDCDDLSDLYCPVCHCWNLKLDYAANEGWGFRCSCGFMFGIIN